jgi:hypothetical protein
MTADKYNVKKYLELNTSEGTIITHVTDRTL